MMVRKKVKSKVKPKPKAKKKAVVAKAKPKPHPFDEVREVVKRAKAFQIVKGKSYLYFCVQPTQEAIVFQQVLKKRLLNIVSIYNYKDNIIGYLIEFPIEKPHLDISKTGEGAAIFFSEKIEHKKLKLAFADQKLRVLSFDDQDFFVSVKWKSNQMVEEC
jgi:hypothetical protein